MRTRGVALASLALAWSAGLASSARAAEPAPAAKGHFESKTVNWDITDAFAFPDEVGMGDDRGILVALSNTSFDAETISDFNDRRYVIDNWMRSDNTAVVYLHFTPQGRCLGLSFYRGPGDGCGFCSAHVTGSAKLEGSRLRGSLASEEKGHAFHVTLDVPVRSSDLGKRLGAGGGEAGKVYLAFHAAAAKRDEAAARKLMVPGREDAWQALAQQDPKDVRITEGFEKPERALLLIAGESAVAKVKGEVLLVKQAGAWKVQTEYTTLDVQ